MCFVSDDFDVVDDLPFDTLKCDDVSFGCSVNFCFYVDEPSFLHEGSFIFFENGGVEGSSCFCFDDIENIFVGTLYVPFDMDFLDYL